MISPDDSDGFPHWVNAVLTGTGWTAETLRDAAASEDTDLATVALADGFGAVAQAMAYTAEQGGGVL
ncbi:Uncharacterised protein [Mycobacteroides abscessus subsp. abscessus]|uniref:hypothetical protein n=1 Tax=Mycobacteroides abscessus TaxID=36809 RepID=UPI000929D1E8|nr:hypothetical protein [Mycobacteroides abscessus]SIJ22585.1 Uncharacterised protein [Mycobacteroides abscessus subsp. abscessus]SLH38143.1 Uncharacterised protein [Mycobacteroides abscessus subsp. abscessus]